MDRLDRILRELDTLLSAEQRQQHQHPLVSSHPGTERELPREWALQDPHLVARLELGALRQLDQPVALALAEVIDDLISDARRPDTVHDQADDTDAPAAPAGGVPLRLDGEETITRKEGRRISILRPRLEAREGPTADAAPINNSGSWPNSTDNG